jgi:hypothetical protein
MRQEEEEKTKGTENGRMKSISSRRKTEINEKKSEFEAQKKSLTASPEYPQKTHTTPSPF